MPMSWSDPFETFPSEGTTTGFDTKAQLGMSGLREMARKGVPQNKSLSRQCCGRSCGRASRAVVRESLEIHETFKSSQICRSSQTSHAQRAFQPDGTEAPVLQVTSPNDASTTGSHWESTMCRTVQLWA